MTHPLQADVITKIQPKRRWRFNWGLIAALVLNIAVWIGGMAWVYSCIQGGGQ
jgi:hypothetical protein